MNRKIRNDIILFLSIIILSLAAILAIHLLRDKGGFVSVLIDGKETSRYSISENKRIDIISSENSGDINVLVIENGEAWIESASCPDKICVNHRKISKAGETIVCLPNKVVVKISADDGVDLAI